MFANAREIPTSGNGSQFLGGLMLVSREVSHVLGINGVCLDVVGRVTNPVHIRFPVIEFVEHHNDVTLTALLPASKDGRLPEKIIHLNSAVGNGPFVTYACYHVNLLTFIRMHGKCSLQFLPVQLWDALCSTMHAAVVNRIHPLLEQHTHVLQLQTALFGGVVVSPILG